MAHRIDGRKLSRKHGPRMALYRNLTVSILRYERVRTTEAKAKEVRGRVERMITLAKKGDLASRRTVISEMPNEPLVVRKLFDEIAPKYADRQSGFTRIVRIGQRPGDAAEIVQIELLRLRLLQHDQQRAVRDLIPFVHVHGGDGAAGGRRDPVLHLHRFQDHQQLTLFDHVVAVHVNFVDHSLHGAADLDNLVRFEYAVQLGRRYRIGGQRGEYHGQGDQHREGQPSR